MTIVRIVIADPRTGSPPDGGAVNGQQLIVLADDTGHRAVPLWLPGLDFKLLWWLLDRPAGDAVLAGVLEETAAGLLHAAGVAVTAVDIEPAGEDVPELRSDTAAARVELATAAGTRHVTVSAGYGLKLAVVAGAPVRVADEVIDRLAVPVQGEDVHAPFLLPSAVRPPGDPCSRAACMYWRIFRRVCFMSPCAYTAGRRRIARMIRLAGVAAGRARRADLLAALALTVSRARSASRSRSPCRESASWVVMVYMMFSFRSSPPGLAAVHTGDERAGARWTARGGRCRDRGGRVRHGGADDPP